MSELHVPGGDAHGPGGTGVDQDEEQLGLAGQLAAHRWPAGALTGPGRHPAEGHLELEQVAGDHLPPEPGLLDAAEQRELAGKARVGQHGHPAQLGQGLDHEHPGQGGAPREVTGEERLVTGQLPAPRWPTGRVSRIEQLGDEEERRPMGQDVDRVRHLLHRPETIDTGPRRTS